MYLIKRQYQDNNINRIKENLLNINRLAGGSIFNKKISEKINIDDNYLFINKEVNQSQEDINCETIINTISHPLQCGYMLLDKPKIRKGARLGKNGEVYLHAFSEPLFSCVILEKKINEETFSSKPKSRRRFCCI